MKTQTEPDSPQLVYQVQLPLSTQTLQLVTAIIAAYRKKIKSRWRKLPDHQAALLVIAYLRHDHRLRDLAGGNHISASTLHRWVDQVLTGLAARAPRLHRALATAARTAGQHVLLDATLIRTRRRNKARKRADYSGKHRCHGLLFTALTDPAGNLLWISAAKPGRTHDATAARHQRIAPALHRAALGCLADMAYSALDPIVITGRRPQPKRPLTKADLIKNQIIALDRACNEHAFAYLKNWRILTKLRTHPSRATALLRALLVLTRIHNPR